jgi:hypothetical protein
VNRIERLGRLEAEFPQELTVTGHLELSMTATVLDLLDRPEELQRMRDDWEERVCALEEVGKKRIAAKEAELAQARIAHLNLVSDVCMEKTLAKAEKDWETDPERMLRKYQRDRHYLVSERRRRYGLPNST